MASTETIYINFTGGIVSPGSLKEILDIAASCKVPNVRFGLRQQLVLYVPVKQVDLFTQACNQKNISYAFKKDAKPNIVSSYPAAGIFAAESWLREGVYKDVFASFDYQPSVKINIIDGSQSFFPFFTGHINWISSSSAHFWYLYIRLPKTQQAVGFPQLIYTNDIAAVSKKVEALLAADATKDVNEIYRQVKETVAPIGKPLEKELQLPPFSLPYYEGFNKHENNFWLGIYRREEVFPVHFLSDLCTICIQTKVGQLYTTTWKSIIVKGIEAGERQVWDRVLGRYRINVRHAANELNWQVEDNCESGLQIKRQIIRHFDKEDVRTYGLSFAVKTRQFSSMFGSVIIRQQEVKNPGRLKALERFEILYTADFNPNSTNLVSFRKDIEKEHLGTYLVSLCKNFYDRETTVSEPFETANSRQPEPVVHLEKILFQCKNCFTVYDELLGDNENQIAAGTSFNDLPADYHCPLCNSAKEDFIAIEAKSLRYS